ncbi:MAG: hypothetical protein E3K37_10855 [Candidatus Kuenenia sp.]|nr:hypothetical protein [Candidatus Kuenenia hertensis]
MMAVVKYSMEKIKVYTRKRLAARRRLLILLITIITTIFLSYIPYAKGNGGVLIINSNESVKKYSLIQGVFKTNFEGSTTEMDIGSNWLDEKKIEKSIGDTNPDLIFSIGSKAYIMASRIAKDTNIIYSLGINWQRFMITDKTYVIASELPPMTNMMMYRYFFPDIKTVGIIYSKNHNKEWFMKAITESEQVGIKIIGRAITKEKEASTALNYLLPKVDALWLISDPVVLSGMECVNEIFARCDALKIPVFSYDQLFANFGASFIISADVATMGEQAAKTAQNIQLNNTAVEKVQNPAGTYIAINVKKIEQYGIKLNTKALSSVNEFIE